MFLRLVEQSFDSLPESPSRLWRARACDEHGNVGAVQNATSQIAHDVVTQQTARLRRAGHNQVVIAVAYFFEDLVDHDSVPEMHFSGDADPVEFSFLAAQIRPELRL